MKMIISEFVLMLGGLTSLGALGGTYWRMRRGGPENEAKIVAASTLLLAQLQNRIAALEARTAALELENAIHERNLLRYAEKYGPLAES